MNWALIAEKIEHALTLSGAELSEYLQTISNSDEAADITRLLQLAHPSTRFMATSAPEGIVDEEQLEQGTIIDSWKIEEHLGRGGMGDVYRATRADGLYEQTVALKIIQGVSKERANWFETERKRLAMMTHPGISRIIDGGMTTDGRSYMVMEFVDGEDILTYVGAKLTSNTNKISLFCEICDSVEHAHSKLVLHRDIKVNNVIISSDGTPKLIDFGIAYDLAGDDDAMGALSIATAAPEQLKGESLSVQTDIFSLAMLLHELLTGHRPKRLADAGVEVDLNAVANSDLSAILERATALSPTERYSSVSEFKDDLMAYLEKRPVSARDGIWHYKVKKFIQRHPLPTALASLTIVAILVGLTTSIKFATEAQNEANRANAALEEAQENLKRSEFFLTRSDLFHATQSAYADSLQSMFGNDADVERQTQILKERWQQAYDLRDQDPNNAAFLSYAIGRHFLFRNDYLTAIDILRPWIEEAYGPEELAGYGTQLLAIAYMSTGNQGDALPMLRATEQWLASSYDAESPDHIATANNIANITREESDIVRAEELLQIGLAKDHADPITMFFWNELSRMRQHRGDFDGAYIAASEVFNIVEKTPLMERSGTDTGTLNLIDFEVMHTRDMERADYLLDLVMTSSKKNKGESRELGIAYSVSALINFAKGNLQTALEDIDRAIMLGEKYTGKSSQTVLNMRIKRAEILAALKQDNANDALTEAITLLTNEDGTQRAKTRTDLADIFITTQLSGIDAGQEKYLQLEPNMTAVSRNLELTYLWSNLQELGIKEPAN